MRILAVLLLTMMMTSPAMAKTEWEFYPLNLQTRVETSDQQELAVRQARNFAAGALSGGYGMLLEMSWFETESGGSYSKISRQHEEVVLWLRREIGGWRELRFQAGAGVGGFRESARTEIEDLRVHDTGTPEPLAGVSLASAWTIKKTLRLALEGRLLFASSLQPSPQPDVVLRTGIAF